MPGRSDRQPSDRRAWFYLATALALGSVLLSPFSAQAGAEALVPWLWVNTALTGAVALRNLVRPAYGCLEILVPGTATCVLVGSVAALPDLVGPWLPLAHGLVVVLLLVGWRRRSRGGGK